MKKVNLKQTVETLRQANSILLCTHLQPDGDAIGSALAAEALMKALEKDITVVCHDVIPQSMRILSGWEKFRLPKDVQGKTFDLGCSIDASDIERLGDAAGLFRSASKTLVIDHHASNTCFGNLNYIDSKVAASGNLVFRLFEEAKVPITKEVASYLYAAVSTDTGNFSFGQMDEEFFLQVSKLMRAGLDISTYSRALHLNKDLNFYKLLSRALASLTFYCEGKLTSMQLYERDFIETETSHDMTEGLVNYALNIAGVQMCFLATQLDNGQVKFSLRALYPHNVSEIAVEFGGGGHLLAAGCTLTMSFDEAVTKMKERMMKSVCL